MIEQVLLSNLIYNEEFARKTIPFIKREYFENQSDKVVFDLIDAYINKYNAFPSKEALSIDLSNLTNINEEQFKSASVVIDNLVKEENTNIKWLSDQAEAFCKEKALKNAIIESINIIGDKDKKASEGMIPKLLQDALSISFDTNIGHDFIEDASKRFEYYHNKEARIPFDIDLLNKITAGGIPPKTLNIILGGVNVGKTLIMCHLASSYLMQGKNVLYITLEMAEMEITKRIDANLMDIAINDLMSMSKDSFMKKISLLKNKTQGKLKVKEYPTASASAANFRHLLNELKIKSNFIPDVIFVDYINICVSSRFRATNNHNSYTIVKAIAEELRGLGVEFNVPVWSGTQLTRSGFASSDVGLEDTAESFGLPAVADFMIAAIQTEQYEALNQYLMKQLKNRYNQKNTYKKIVVGVDVPKMRLYDVEQEAQDEMSVDKPIMDNTDIGRRVSDEVSKSSKFTGKFQGFS